MSVQYVSYNVISSAKAESKVSPTPPSIASNGIRTSKLFNVGSENDQYKEVFLIVC